MKMRTIYQVITEAKSSPTGVDWLTIMAARQVMQQRRYSRRPVSMMAASEPSKKQHPRRSW
ncbi:hypothetical protein ACFL6S_26795 [Candidatus Poribacteria bacterium]